METMFKTNSKKISSPDNFGKMKINSAMNLKNKADEKKNFIRHLIHPDYILFDWEFFSNQLEFE